MTLVSPKKWYSEYNCNCQDKNGQKHYDDQHQVQPARWTILRRRFPNGILKRSPWTRKKKENIHLIVFWEAEAEADWTERGSNGH